jgi:cytochrome c5
MKPKTRITRKSLFLIFFIPITACSIKLAAPEQSDVDRVITKYPGYNLAQLDEGKALFQQTCNRCHQLKNPKSRDETKWNHIVPVMIKKLNAKEGREVIDSDQQEKILRYLVTMSSTSVTVK